jgi:hypothetical protein
MELKNSKRPINRIGLRGEIIETFPTAKAAATELKLPKNSDSNIIKCCKGDRDSAAGYKWKFADELKNTNNNNQVYLYAFTDDELFEGLYGKMMKQAILETDISRKKTGNKHIQPNINKHLPQYLYIVHLLILDAIGKTGTGKRKLKLEYIGDDICTSNRLKPIINAWVELGVIEQPDACKRRKDADGKYSTELTWYKLTEAYKVKIRAKEYQKESFIESSGKMIKKMLEFSRFCNQEHIINLSSKEKRDKFQEHWKDMKHKQEFKVAA